MISSTTERDAAHAPLSRIIAHRGASGDAPENTLAALSMAADHGADCVEIDVSISRDNVAFVHHDDTLQRCTSGHGLLSECTASQLDQLDASKGHPDFQNEPLPRLTAVVELLVAKGLGLNLEIKPLRGLEKQTVHAIANAINQWPTHLPLVFSSFSREALDWARKELPDIPRALLLGRITDDWESLMDTYQCQNLHCSAKSFEEEQAKQVLQKGFGLYCYTVNDSDLASQLFSSGVHGVFTDFPKRLLQSLEA